MDATEEHGDGARGYKFLCFHLNGALSIWTPADENLAEREGFEPSIRFCRILTFQASAFDHSATAPHLPWRAPI